MMTVIKQAVELKRDWNVAFCDPSLDITLFTIMK